MCYLSPVCHALSLALGTSPGDKFVKMTLMFVRFLNSHSHYHRC